MMSRPLASFERVLLLLLFGAMSGCQKTEPSQHWMLTPLSVRPEEPDGATIQDQNDFMANASPDGTRVLFTSRRSGTFRLYVMGVDGGNVHALTSGPGTQMQGSWSPDGKRIVYVHREEEKRYLALMNSDASETRPLVDVPGSWPTPSWSPDGRRVLFHADGPFGSNDAWSIDVETGEKKALLGSESSDRQPMLSPDGLRVVFISRRDGDDDEVYVANLDGGPWTQLTDNDVNDYTPTWSPDGTRIVFQSPRAGRWTIFTINADGTDETPVTEYPMQYDPVWSYDGQEIFFNSDRDGRRGIYVMNADGLNPRKLTNTEPSELVRVVREAGVDEAARVFRAARAENPDAVYFYEDEIRYLGENYLEMGDLRKAELLFQINVEAYPESARTHMDLGEARLATGEVELAIESYRRALDLNPKETRVETLLAQLDSRARSDR